MNLKDSVSVVPLVGPRYKQLLENLEIKTIHDLLYHFPFRYNDFSQRKKISELMAGETATVVGELKEVKTIFTRTGRNFVQAVLADETGQLRLAWFNQPFITKTLKVGETLGVSGPLGAFGNKPALISPEYEVFTGHDFTHTGRLVPIYPETTGVSSKWLRSRLKWLLSNLTADDIAETLPDNVLITEKFANLFGALQQIHFPASQQDADKARGRFAFEELFTLSLKSLIRKKIWSEQKITKKLTLTANQNSQITAFTNSLPFKLTGAQTRVVGEILADLTKPQPMNRLLEGDVGSGKTVVAAIAAYAAILNGANVLYMAPTEILARQHFETFKALFSKYNVGAELVIGGSRGTACRAPTKNVILIGTHALLYRENFDNVGLAIIDEQHRFGVEQRAKLVAKCGHQGIPHLLTMTATPIPRSLQLILTGDLDLSVIDEMPIGRKPVKTWVVAKEKRGDAYSWVKSQCSKGTARCAPTMDKVFVVCPFIEESESETLASVRAATKEFEGLQKHFAPLKVGLLHGRLKSAEKAATVNDFRQGRLDILVTTPVVEVGVDIPEASIMIIEGAERFGLASLHQLRGRVGRGGQEAYCLLFTSDDRGETARLKYLETVYNGAKLAEIDLKFRGGGDIFGTTQHGLPRFKVADPSNIELITKARDWAEQVLDGNKAEGIVGDIKKELVAPN